LELIKGKYRIVREIARSNDIVYEAIDTALNRRIALKELNLAPGLVGNARRDRIERFHREARAAGRLSHPNVVSIFDFGEENGRHYIAMEYLDGQNLRDALQVRGAVPLHEALDILCQVLDALSYAHANSVIHRDVKPDNIHILPGGHVKITDFGIARLTEEIALTGDGQIFGTPSYMSPEQIVGKGIDCRSDLFSAAVVLYEMLTGRKPFIGDNVVSITYAIMNAAPPPLVGVPPSIERVILSALAKEPAHRPVSAAAMRTDLRAAERMPAAPPPGVNASGQFAAPAFPPAVPAAAPPPAYGPAIDPAAFGAPPGYGAQGLPPTGYPATGYPPSGYAPAGAPPPGYAPQNAPQPQQAGGTFMGGRPPGPWAWNGAPAGARRPRGPRRRFALPTLSPSSKALIAALAIAIVAAGCIVGGVVAFMNAYDNYRKSADTRHVSDLIAQGYAAYVAGSYAQAVGLFEQAKAAGPNADQLQKINHNLGAAYTSIGIAAEKALDPAAARRAYEAASAADPASPGPGYLRRLDERLAGAGEAVGGAISAPGPARSERAGQPGGSTYLAPARNGAPGPAGSPGPTGAPVGSGAQAETQAGETERAAAPTTQASPAPSPTAVQDSESERMRLAAQYMREGDDAARSGDRDRAREAYGKVIEAAAGTDLAAEARTRLGGLAGSQ
jgi:serine/threonine-protein kinase